MFLKVRPASEASALRAAVMRECHVLDRLTRVQREWLTEPGRAGQCAVLIADADDRVFDVIQELLQAGERSDRAPNPSRTAVVESGGTSAAGVDRRNDRLAPSPLYFTAREVLAALNGKDA